MNLMSAAMAIANVLGISDTVLSLFGGNNGDTVAQKIIDITHAVTGKKTVIKSIELLGDPQMAERVEEAILQQEVELRKLAFGDRQNAREMQGELLVHESEDRFTKRFIYYFALFWAVIASGYLFAITFVDISPAATRFADTILGFLLGTVISGIIGFFYGASFKSPKPK